MKYGKTLRVTVIGAICLGLAACGGGNRSGEVPANTARTISQKEEIQRNATKSSIFDFLNAKPDQTVQVNRYLWTASLDVLSFLPVQSVDPFTGVIVTGYGTPPGGGRSYRATIHIKDPALDARSLNVALQSKSGAVSASTTRAVEDAILSRARQLRIADKKL
ncbi:DUF3576 domain-containing protein [Leisingera aquaemixtae]|uniref:DUF3576 domain-containing protein n=1 Tax=Leisingera aquaemixtae TaxID=1396826 RepID=UPI001C94B4E3|nr:DUF3576 domain-containing protein [Leisingera aquaemixtae]MBY6066162.1 DUF3576 domain-containing protein [Leisingera aquaemixtae]